MPLAAIEAMLKDVIGLDVESIGRGAVARAVADRQHRCGIGDPQQYWEYLAASPAERQQLINNVIVPETWFFRDREAFTALTSLVFERLERRPDATVRLLSLPCASGEEVYSIAMTLLDANITANRFAIDGVDVSDRQVERARAGVYGKGSFRSEDLAFRQRHFTRDGDRYRVNDEVRDHVAFHHRSLFSADLALPSRSYDVIWCRNLLIYFDRQTQDAAVRILGSLLATDGLLFVGSSETAVIPSTEFESVRMPMAFAFRRRVPGAAAPRPVPAAPQPRRLIASSASRITPPVARRTPPAARPIVVPPTASSVVSTRAADARTELEEIQQLADGGRFDEAATRCEAHLRRYRPSAEALHLQALISDASGRHMQAEKSYRKALYLEPGHREALLHLGLLLHRQGRTGDAIVIRERLQRLERGCEA
jgi:chemotaxis protein methyltransferase WspC